MCDCGMTASRMFRRERYRSLSHRRLLGLGQRCFECALAWIASRVSENTWPEFNESALQCEIAASFRADLQSYHSEIVIDFLQLFSLLPERFRKCCIARSQRA
jgi:hypothetical protein